MTFMFAVAVILGSIAVMILLTCIYIAHKFNEITKIEIKSETD